MHCIFIFNDIPQQYHCVYVVTEQNTAMLPLVENKLLTWQIFNVYIMTNKAGKTEKNAFGKYVYSNSYYTFTFFLMSVTVSQTMHLYLLRTHWSYRLSVNLVYCSK
jgi:hypothetical protein